MERESSSFQRKAKSKRASESSTGMDTEDSPMRFVDLRRFLHEIAMTGVELQTAVDNRPSHTDCVIACRREQSRNVDMEIKRESKYRRKKRRIRESKGENERRCKREICSRCHDQQYSTMLRSKVKGIKNFRWFLAVLITKRLKALQY